MKRTRPPPKPLFPSPEVRREGDALVLTSSRQLAHYARCTGTFLEHWAGLAPERSFLAERASSGAWRHLNYGEALVNVRRISAWLLVQGFSGRKPVVIVSRNGIEPALLTLACLQVGIPVAPIAPAHSRNRARLGAIIELLDPGLIYVGAGARRALAVLPEAYDGVIVGGDDTSLEDVVSFDSLVSGIYGANATRNFAAITPATVAKVLLTVDAQGEAKGVIHTQRMLCANQQAIAQLWPGVEDPPVLLDGPPWHDPVAGSLNFDLALRNGGVLYIDRGRPRAGKFDVTLANLRDVAPTIFSSTPAAYELLIPALRRDTRLRKRFFRRLTMAACVGAVFPQELADALQALARETIARDLPLVSWWGWPETSLASVAPQSALDEPAHCLPLPGTEIKLVPVGDLFEARLRGPNVTPGYWKRLDLTASAFDQDGFFKTGTAVRFVDPARPERGLLWAERTEAELERAAASHPPAACRAR